MVKINVGNTDPTVINETFDYENDPHITFCGVYVKNFMVKF